MRDGGLRRFTRLGCLLLAAALLCPAFASAQAGDGLAADIRVIGAVAKLHTDKLDRPRAMDSDHPRCTRPVRRGCRRAINARAMRLYERMLPAPLEPARHPRIGFWLTEASAPRYVAGAPFTEVNHWMEGAIQLRVSHTDGAGEREGGWYQVSYPVNSEFWFQAGRAVGLPKLHATMTSEPTASGWRMDASAPGAASPRFALDFTPGEVAASPSRIRLADRTALDPFFALNPAMEGPDLNRVQYSVSPPSPQHAAVPGGPPPYDPKRPPEVGTVRLDLDPDIDAFREDLRDLLPAGATLADLVDLDRELPGIHRFNRLSLGSETRKVGQGGYER